MHLRPRRAGLALSTAVAAVVLAGCAQQPSPSGTVGRVASTGGASAVAPAPSTAPAGSTRPGSPPPGSTTPGAAAGSTTVSPRRHAARPVAPLVAAVRPDVLVTSAAPLPDAALRRLAALGTRASVVFRSGTVQVAGRPVPAVAVDPSTFRVVAEPATAAATGVWRAVANGEAVASHALARTRVLPLGGGVQLQAATAGTPIRRRVGAHATTGVPGTDLVLDDATGEALGLPAATGVLLAGPEGGDPVALAARVREITGDAAQVDLLTPPAADPVAFLTGGEASRAFGAFSYRYFSDGTIEPDAAWVRENIRTEQVPVFGRVTCHRLMLPQLRGALAEVEERGLAGTLHTYDGCYVPRFIERNPERSISLHTWGIAIDLDAATNYRGIRGTMHPEVVRIFKRWGFRWGGDWGYTDPMHFELSAVLEQPPG